jgi:hypothetical protein
VVVVLLGVRFLVLEERSVDFFDVAFIVVPPVLETVLLTVFAGVLLVPFADVLLAVLAVALLVVRDADVADRVAGAAVPVDAIASI